MKTPSQRLAQFAWFIPALLLAGITVQSANGAAVEMYGSMSWHQWGGSYYYSWVNQTGRLASTGTGWYRSGDISVGYVHNRSWNTRSGSLSMEFWAMPYYGASSGYVKMSRSIAPLWPGYYRYGYYRSGVMRYTGQWRYPEFNLYEYTGYGWAWRDDFLFYSPGYL